MPTCAGYSPASSQPRFIRHVIPPGTFTVEGPASESIKTFHCPFPNPAPACLRLPAINKHQQRQGHFTLFSPTPGNADVDFILTFLYNCVNDCLYALVNKEAFPVDSDRQP